MIYINMLSNRASNDTSPFLLVSIVNTHFIIKKSIQINVLTLVFIWYPRSDSNRHDHRSKHFECFASTNFATRAEWK